MNGQTWRHRKGDGYVLITASLVGDERGHAIERCLWPGEFKSVIAACAAGFRDLDRSDDFNIGAMRGGKLVAILWMDEIVDDEPDVVERIAAEVGL